MKKITLLGAALLLTLTACSPDDTYTTQSNPIVNPTLNQKCLYRVVKYSTIVTPNIVMFDSIKIVPMAELPFMYSDNDGVIIGFRPIQYGQSDYYNSNIDNIGQKFGYLRVEIFRDANY